MGVDTKIAWAHSSFNPIRGCSRVSPGCEHCYAERMAKRNPAIFGRWGKSGTRVLAAPAMWSQPLFWNKEATKFNQRYRVFCASVADIFEDWSGPIIDSRGNQMVHGPDGSFIPMIDEQLENASGVTMDCVLEKLIALTIQTQNLDWLFLTKRPENIPNKLKSYLFLSNVWMGATGENQKYADIRVGHLSKLKDLSPVRFLSVEPMLGPVDLEIIGIDAINWVICGCEQGPGNSPIRPMETWWARKLRDDCRYLGIAFFMKQMEVDGKVTDDINKFPEDLRIRQFPVVAKA